jgi:hypothetical protein
VTLPAFFEKAHKNTNKFSAYCYEKGEIQNTFYLCENVWKLNAWLFDNYCKVVCFFLNPKGLAPLFSIRSDNGASPFGQKMQKLSKN